MLSVKMMRFIVFIFWLMLNPLCLYSREGVSLSKMLNMDGWADLLAETPSTSFAIVHALYFNGAINSNLGTTLQAAWNSSIEDLSLFMHPCIQSSVYSQTFQLSCGSAEDQLNTIVDHLDSYSIEFDRHIIEPTDTGVSPTSMPTSSPTFSNPNASVYRVQRLYIDIEDESPSRYMSNAKHTNVQFMADLVNAALRKGIQVGVFTTKKDWFNIMTDKLAGTNDIVYFTSENGTYNATNPFAHLPLWTPRYDQINSMDFYAPFAGWERVYIKQTTGGTTSLRRTSSDRIGTNYIDDADTNTTNAVTSQILEYVVL